MEFEAAHKNEKVREIRGEFGNPSVVDVKRNTVPSTPELIAWCVEGVQVLIDVGASWKAILAWIEPLCHFLPRVIANEVCHLTATSSVQNMIGITVLCSSHPDAFGWNDHFDPSDSRSRIWRLR